MTAVRTEAAVPDIAAAAFRTKPFECRRSRRIAGVTTWRLIAQPGARDADRVSYALCTDVRGKRTLADRGTGQTSLAEVETDAGEDL